MLLGDTQIRLFNTLSLFIYLALYIELLFSDLAAVECVELVGLLPLPHDRTVARTVVWLMKKGLICDL